MEKIKVLVVHNKRGVTKTVEECINNLSYAEVVGTARNGKNAYKKAMELNPEVLLMKYKLKDMEATKIIDKLEEEKDRNFKCVKFLSNDMSIPVKQSLYKYKNKHMIIKELGTEGITKFFDKYYTEK